MTLRDPLWMEGASYAGDEDRILIETLFSEGVLNNGLAVTQRAAGTNMSVDVAAGACVIVGDDTSGQGSYLCKSTAVENVTIGAAPGGGNTRIDRIVAQVRDGTVLGSGNHDWVITAVAGTASGTPSAPALPASAISLATVSVAAGTVAVTNAMITDVRSAGGVSTSLDEGSVGTDELADGSVTAAKTSGEQWTVFTPSLTTGGSGFSIGNGTVAGRYMQRGKDVVYSGKITLGSTSGWGVGAGLGVDLPVTPQTVRGAGAAAFYDDSTQTGYAGSVFLLAVNQLIFACDSGALDTNDPFIWANNDVIQWTIVYEAA